MRSGRRIACPKHACSISSSFKEVGSSWISIDTSNDGYGGWIVHEVEEPVRTGFSRFVVAGVGSSVVILLASFASFAFARKGFRFQLLAPFTPLDEIPHSSEPAKRLTKESEFHAFEVLQTELDDKSKLAEDSSLPEKEKLNITSSKRGYKMVPVAVDFTQKEALSLLQKLKIIESDARPYELCTRREYARWLVKVNSLLERNPRHRIVPSVLVAGSTVTAFDDVNKEDPDFLFIQAIGEAGIVPSKLSSRNCDVLDNGNSGSVDKHMFFPESFLSRLDLISWKAKLEYPLIPETDEKMLRKAIGLTDLGTVSLEFLQELFMDTLAGKRSILRRVFGNIRRLQPLKPVTKAQVAVSLTSGRPMDAVQLEISRLKAEKMSRLFSAKDIRYELIHKGDIQKIWEEKLNKEIVRGKEVQQALLEASHNLEEERIVFNKEMADHIKEKAALDCQWQLLFSLKEEVDAMSEKLINDEAAVAAERQSLEDMFVNLREEQNAIFEAKSILEAEKEALRILRSWVEDGARRSQFRAKVLEDAAQRWKWDDKAGLPRTSRS